jgi:hypothetical protein
MAKVIYGVSGIKQKDYHVYVGLSDNSTLQSAIDTYHGAPTQANLEALLDAQGGQLATKLQQLGECRADSIDLGIEDGDTVDGNVLGKIVLNKTGKFTAELINATPDNIAALELLDGQSCTILLLERDTHLVSTTEYKTAIIMNEFNLSYSEKITGSDSIRSTINIEKNVPSPSAFRSIHDLAWT